MPPRLAPGTRRLPNTARGRRRGGWSSSLNLGRWRLTPPAAVAPGRVPMRALRRSFRNAIDARCAPWLAAQQARQRRPGAGPKPKTIEGLVGILRAGRQMPAMETDQRRQCIPIDLHEPAAGEAWGVQQVHPAAFAALPFLASI